MLKDTPLVLLGQVVSTVSRIRTNQDRAEFLPIVLLEFDGRDHVPQVGECVARDPVVVVQQGDDHVADHFCFRFHALGYTSIRENQGEVLEMMYLLLFQAVSDPFSFSVCHPDSRR